MKRKMIILEDPETGTQIPCMAEEIDLDEERKRYEERKRLAANKRSLQNKVLLGMQPKDVVLRNGKLPYIFNSPKQEQ